MIKCLGDKTKNIGIKKIMKKNQVVILALALMLMTAGYLNYTNNHENENLLLAGLGDAQLVNSNDVIIDSENIQDESIDVGINTQSTQTTQENSENKGTYNSYFEESKLQRDTMYSQTLETYKEMLNNTNVSEEQKAIITQEITNLSKEKNAIMVCENLITTKGFNNCVIFVNTDSISVVIESDDLKTDEIAQIQNIISREMNAKVEDIHIMTKN